MVLCFFKQKTAYEMRISDWSSDVCSSDLAAHQHMDVRIVGVPMVNGDPVQFGAQILGCISHQFAGEAAQVFHVPCIFGRDDETKEIGRASCRERVCQYV